MTIPVASGFLRVVPLWTRRNPRDRDQDREQILVTEIWDRYRHKDQYFGLKTDRDRNRGLQVEVKTRGPIY